MILNTRLICALMLLGACSDPPAPDIETPALPPVLPLSSALVSSSIASPATSTNPVAGGDAYVSMVPGTIPYGERVHVGNLRTGAAASVLMRDGGFDPLAIEAEAGDTLAVEVVNYLGNSTTAYGVVPARSQPKVVRTSPTGGGTDVSLNSIVRIVFNQPMDSLSLSDALHLRQGGLDVPGSVSGERTGSVILSGEFVPASSLAPLSTYELFVSSAVQSLDGTPLDAPLSVDFTTRAMAGQARLRVVHAEPRVGVMDVFVDRNEVLRDLSYLTVTDYLGLASGSHYLQFVGVPGTFDDFQADFAAGADYTVLPCCALMPNWGLFLDDNSEPPAGQARLRVIDYATAASSVKIYLTPPGTDLATQASSATINVGDATGYFEVPAGDYQIRITAWDSDTVVMDSGTLTLRAGQVRTAVAVDASGGGEPRRLLVLEDLN